MYRVRGKWLANVGRTYRVRGKGLANVGRMYRVRPIFQKRAFWRVLEFDKLANFRRVLEFDKFAGEWPLLTKNPIKIAAGKTPRTKGMQTWLVHKRESCLKMKKNKWIRNDINFNSRKISLSSYYIKGNVQELQQPKILKELNVYESAIE
jgi:hypothetical protein